MASFEDSAGRSWPVEITYATAKRIRQATGVKLGDLLKDGLAPLADLLDDDDRFVAVLFETVRGVTREDLEASLTGDALEAAREAWLAAFVSFCPSQVRPLILAIRAKGAEVERLAREMTAEGITAVDPVAVLTPTSNASASNSPASADSTPAP